MYICRGVGFNFDGQKVAWFFLGRGCFFSNSQGSRLKWMPCSSHKVATACCGMSLWKSLGGDYILRSDEVLAVIEAKRCSPNWIWTLSQGVAQCIWQLAILRESQPLG